MLAFPTIPMIRIPKNTFLLGLGVSSARLRLIPKSQSQSGISKDDFYSPLSSPISISHPIFSLGMISPEHLAKCSVFYSHLAALSSAPSFWFNLSKVAFPFTPCIASSSSLARGLKPLPLRFTFVSGL